MFKFNFQHEDQETNVEFDNEQSIVTAPFGCFTVDQIDSSQFDQDKAREKFEAFQSDLVPSVYEGGFKTWECSHDLVDYLKTIVDEFSSMTSVLEVGCGTALPGLELNRIPRFQVDFQDFNREVLIEIGRALKTNENFTKNRLFFGDWADLIQIVPKDSYDLIISSETIYNVRNYRKLVNLLEHALKPNGVVFLAAKIYYFGVQGGIRQFEDFLTANSSLKSQVVRVIDANVKREIIRLKKF